MQQKRLHDMAAPEFRGKSRLAPEEVGNPHMGITAENLAQRYGLSLHQLVALNPQLKNPNLIRVGEEVRVG